MIAGLFGSSAPEPEPVAEPEPEPELSEPEPQEAEPESEPEQPDDSIEAAEAKALREARAEALKEQSSEGSEGADTASEGRAAAETAACPKEVPRRPPVKMVLAQTMLPVVKIEYSIHELTGALRRTLEVWGKNSMQAAIDARSEGDPDAATRELRISQMAKNVLAIPTWQPSHLDLSVYPSEEVSVERDRLFVRLRKFGKELKIALDALGYWFDVSCPATGGCLFGERGGCTWNELEGLTQLLRYGHVPAGCCGIVLHPDWRKKAYPVTMFSDCPLAVLDEAIQAVEYRWSQGDYAAGCNPEEVLGEGGGNCA